MTETTRPTRLFTLRLWQEHISAEQAEWRGKVQALPEGEAYYFLKRRLWAPTAIAAAAFALLEPLQRLIGIPAFISRETACADGANFAYANAKAKGALGWNPRPPREVWLDTLRGERQLSTRRKTRSLQVLLRPLGIIE